MRVLTDCELILIAGGGSDSEGNDEDGVTVIGGRWDYSGTPGGGMSGGPSGGTSENDSFNRLAFPLIDVDCVVEAQAAADAINRLSIGSPTAVRLLEEARDRGFTINLADDGIDNTHLPSSTINWDPFSALEVVNNNNQVVGHQSAMISLIHELGHAVLWDRVADAPSGDDYGTILEREIIQRYESKVISEMNSYFGRQSWYIPETTRQNHYGNGYNATSSIGTGRAANNTRPGCK